MIIKSTFLRLSTFLLLVIISQNVAVAEIHKWTDENGKVHYSQIAPNNTKTETISPPPPPAVGPNVAEEELSERVEADRKAQQEQYIAEQKADNLKRNEEIQKKNCLAAKKNLDLYSSYGRVRVKETDGTYTHLTEEDRQQRIIDMKAKVKEFCHSPLPETVSSEQDVESEPKTPPQETTPTP